MTLDSDHLKYPVPMVWLCELLILLRAPDVGTRAPTAEQNINHWEKNLERKTDLIILRIIIPSMGGSSTCLPSTSNLISLWSSLHILRPSIFLRLTFTYTPAIKSSSSYKKVRVIIMTITHFCLSVRVFVKSTRSSAGLSCFLTILSYLCYEVGMWTSLAVPPWRCGNPDTSQRPGLWLVSYSQILSSDWLLPSPK